VWVFEGFRGRWSWSRVPKYPQPRIMEAGLEKTPMCLTTRIQANNDSSVSHNDDRWPKGHCVGSCGAGRSSIGNGSRISPSTIYSHIDDMRYQSALLHQGCASQLVTEIFVLAYKMLHVGNFSPLRARIQRAGNIRGADGYVLVGTAVEE